METNQLTITLQDGTEQLANILFTHEANGKNYVVFEFAENGEISAATYTAQNDEEGMLGDIETDEEWDMLDKLLDDYFSDLELDEDNEEETDEDL